MVLKAKCGSICGGTYIPLCLAKYPDKTIIGRIQKGFDWLGYHICPDGLSVATKTLQNFVSRISQLYEQEPREGDTSSRLGDYVKRWIIWVRAGVSLCSGYPPCDAGRDPIPT